MKLVEKVMVGLMTTALVMYIYLFKVILDIIKTASEPIKVAFGILGVIVVLGFVGTGYLLVLMIGGEKND